MSSYKVIQDIEAEDKLIGPLTLRQSIYGGITLVCLYICFLGFTKGATFLIAMFLPVAAITGFFAFPWKGEQPTEIWALARLRFMIKPRVRVWDQSGVKDVVTVLAPRKLENVRPLTNNLSENEVRSRLKALADTIDSRGWATRNASYALYSSQYQSRVSAPGQAVPNAPAADDMFDDHSNVAQNFDAMLARSSQNQRQRVVQQMAQAQMPPQIQQAPRPAYQVQTAYQQPQGGQPMQPSQQMPMYPQQGPQQGPQPQQYPQPQQQYPQAQQGYGPMPPQAPAYQAGPQLPAPIMPQQQQPAPNSAPADYWFANGPAYPGNGNIPQQQPQAGQPMQPPQQPPMYPQQQAPAPEPTAPQAVQPQPPVLAAPAIPEEYAAAVAEGKISTDVPLAGSATPNENEQAFAQEARQQNEALRRQYNHVTVDPASGAAVRPTPSVPGMIDYGRPQPVDDQMQYDTSQPQTIQQAAQIPGAVQAAGSPVTGTTDPAILGLAKNDDLDVATIARQANKEITKNPDEIEIQLH